MIQFDLPCSTFGRKSQVKLPGFESVPSGLAAATTEPGNYGFWLLVSIAGQAELAAWTESDDKEPGSREMWGYSVRVFFGVQSMEGFFISFGGFSRIYFFTVP